jgi:hypothetical protein
MKVTALMFQRNFLLPFSGRKGVPKMVAALSSEVSQMTAVINIYISNYSMSSLLKLNKLPLILIFNKIPYG